MRVEIEERETINKVYFGSLAPGAIFRKLDEFDNVLGSDSFYMKLSSSCNRTGDEKSNTASIGVGSKSCVCDEQFVQPFEDGFLTTRHLSRIKTMLC